MRGGVPCIFLRDSATKRPGKRPTSRCRSPQRFRSGRPRADRTARWYLRVDTFRTIARLSAHSSERGCRVAHGTCLIDGDVTNPPALASMARERGDWHAALSRGRRGSRSTLCVWPVSDGPRRFPWRRCRRCRRTRSWSLLHPSSRAWGRGPRPRPRQTEPIHVAETRLRPSRHASGGHRKRGGKGFRATGTTDILSHGDSVAPVLGLQHPEPNGSRRATTYLSFSTSTGTSPTSSLAYRFDDESNLRNLIDCSATD